MSKPTKSAEDQILTPSTVCFVCLYETFVGLSKSHLPQVTDLLVSHLHKNLNDEVDGLRRVAVNLQNKNNFTTKTPESQQMSGSDEQN